MREMQLFWSNDWKWQCLYEVEKSKNKGKFGACSSLLSNQQSKFKNDLYVNFFAIIVGEWPELSRDLFWWQQTWHFLIKCLSYVPASAALFMASKTDLFLWLLQEQVWEPHAWLCYKRFLTTWTFAVAVTVATAVASTSDAVAAITHHNMLFATAAWK